MENICISVKNKDFGGDVSVAATKNDAKTVTLVNLLFLKDQYQVFKSLFVLDIPFFVTKMRKYSIFKKMRDS